MSAALSGSYRSMITNIRPSSKPASFRIQNILPTCRLPSGPLYPIWLFREETLPIENVILDLRIDLQRNTSGSGGEPGMALTIAECKDGDSETAFERARGGSALQLRLPCLSVSRARPPRWEDRINVSILSLISDVSGGSIRLDVSAFSFEAMLNLFMIVSSKSPEIQ